jgi:hypothetical protein
VVLGVAVVWASATPFSYAANYSRNDLCAGYTVVKRAYPPSVVPTDIVVKCPVPATRTTAAGWRDWLTIKGVLQRCPKVLFSVRPEKLTITCAK